MRVVVLVIFLGCIWASLEKAATISGATFRQRRTTTNSFALSYPQKLIDEKQKCSNNPTLVEIEQGRKIPECPHETGTGVAEHPELGWPTHAFVIGFESKRGDFEERRKFLKKMGIDLQRWPAINGSAVFDTSEYATVWDENLKKYVRIWNNSARNVTSHEGADDGYLTLGERGLLLSAKHLFMHAIAHKEMKNIMIVEEDVLFDCNFKQVLLNALRDERCGAQMTQNSKKGGILSLGSNIWRPDWVYTDKTIADLRAQYGETPKCFNAHDRVFGAHAVLYHRDTFQYIVDWIEEYPLPFDLLYGYVAHQGHVVRHVYPFIAIQNVMHVSTIGNRSQDLVARARSHRWDLQRFCLPDGRPLSAILPEINAKGRGKP